MPAGHIDLREGLNNSTIQMTGESPFLFNFSSEFLKKD